MEVSYKQIYLRKYLRSHNEFTYVGKICICAENAYVGRSGHVNGVFDEK